MDHHPLFLHKFPGSLAMLEPWCTDVGGGGGGALMTLMDLCRFAW